MSCNHERWLRSQRTASPTTAFQTELKILTEVDAFTSEKVFSAQIDSKGRITIPSEVRNILDLENGDEVTLSLPDTEVKEYTVKGPEEALQIIDETEDVKDFEYSAGRLKVVIYG